MKYCNLWEVNVDLTKYDLCILFTVPISTDYWEVEIWLYRYTYFVYIGPLTTIFKSLRKVWHTYWARNSRLCAILFPRGLDYQNMSRFHHCLENKFTTSLLLLVRTQPGIMDKTNYTQNMSYITLVGTN